MCTVVAKCVIRLSKIWCKDHTPPPKKVHTSPHRSHLSDHIFLEWQNTIPTSRLLQRFPPLPMFRVFSFRDVPSPAHLSRARGGEACAWQHTAVRCAGVAHRRQRQRPSTKDLALALQTPLHRRRTVPNQRGEVAVGSVWRRAIGSDMQARHVLLGLMTTKIAVRVALLP